MTRYNEFEIENNELGEEFIAEVTDAGVHLDHNWMEGGLFIPHEKFKELEKFRNEIKEEISE